MSMIPFALNISNLVLLYNSFNYFEAVSKHFWPVRAITLRKYTNNPNPPENLKIRKSKNFSRPRTGNALKPSPRTTAVHDKLIDLLIFLTDHLIYGGLSGKLEF